MLLAGCGGFIGTCGRFLVGRMCASIWRDPFPIGTLTVNTLGCFLIGLFLGMLEKNHLLSSNEGALLITGFCGGFTTFSAFADEIWRLGAKGDWWASILYLSISVILGVLCVWGGRALVR